MTVGDRLAEVQRRIEKVKAACGRHDAVSLVAVTKTHPSQVIIDVYRAGVTMIGENRVQEAASKFSDLPPLPGLIKRLVGHLQSNKVNKALELFDTLDAVDSLSLAQKIGRRAVELNRCVPVLLEVNTSGEETKFGFSTNDLPNLRECCRFPGIIVKGLMTVGPLTEDKSEIRRAFVRLRRLRGALNSTLDQSILPLEELSMGMSDDFEIAIEEGSTMLRLGRVLLGSRRPYP